MRFHLYFFLLCLLLPHYCGAQKKAINRYPVTADGKLKYEYMGKLSSGRKLVINFSQKYGFVDSALRDVVECIYDSATDFKRGKALVKKDGKYGIIDTLGKELIPSVYDSIDGEYSPGGRRSYDVAGRIDNYAWVKTGGIVGVYTIDVHHFEPVTGYGAYFYDRPVANKYMRIYSKEIDVGSGLAFRDGKVALAPRKGQSVGEYVINGRIIISREGKHGFLDSALNIAIPIKYDMVDNFHEKLAAVKLYGKWGYIDASGKLVINVCYDTVENFENGFAVVKRDGKYGVINKGGLEKIPCVYDRFLSKKSYSRIENMHQRGVFSVESNKKWALVDTNNRLLTPFTYNDISASHWGFEVEANKKVGMISYDLKSSIPVVYARIIPHFLENCIAVDNGERWGLIDTFYKVVLPDTFVSLDAALTVWKEMRASPERKSNFVTEPGKYLFVDHFFQGRASVENSAHQWGYINKKGKEVIPCIYQMAGDYRNRKAKVQIGKLYGYINKKGKYIYAPDTLDVDNDKGIWVTSKAERYGIANRAGKLIVPIDYNEPYALTHNRLFVRKDKSYGIIDRKGKEVLPFVYSKGFSYFSEVVCMKKGNQWLIMNKRGHIKVRLDTTLDICSYFREGLAVVKDTSDRYGYINKKGRIVLPCIYNEAKDFNDGGAVVNTTVGKYEMVTYKPYDDDENELEEITERRRIYGDSVGVIDKQGKLIIPCMYKAIMYYSKTELMQVRIHRYDEWGSINTQNELVAPYSISSSWSVYHEEKHKWTRKIENGEWVYRNKRGRVKLRVGYVKDPKA
ncbi:hypothetical protein CJD36_017580 [Flavipsychrobacter stenotrophus]|uniref:WG repeat-containing protein n=1 Tax=Flavipsychrobacter stenotrophus TaxID=2077091 RepID=A0A2S7SS58_9BACT|nr:WG repeat-containing protein [Flavipsychrobacter stenotrophus]PQJ09740.1 hypothetical protein CJD36_017580 [Flavipsychrobacter stenotrophus]